MKPSNSIMIILLSLVSNMPWANCDLTQFRWDCDIPLQIKPTYNTSSRVNCGPYGYISRDDYNTLLHYQRANVYFSLSIDDEYMAGPCLPNRND
jgi:hypothetical protein